MSKKPLIIGGVILVVAVILVLVGVLEKSGQSGNSATGGSANSANPSSSGSSASNSMTSGKASPTAIPAVLPATPVAVAVTPNSGLSALPGSSEAPKQAVVTADKIPASAIKLNVSATGFSPDTFTVSAGATVTLALTATDNNTHVFIFPNASLMGLTTMILGGQSKTLTFNAPAAGSFQFRDDIPAYRSNVGTMIVK